MKIYRWLKSLETGNAVIDSQHRELMGCMNGILAFVDEGKGEQAFETCRKFRVLLEDHFAEEEKILRLAGFPGLESHLEFHEETTERIGQILSTCREDCRKLRSSTCIPDLTFTIVDHMLREDLDFKSFLETRNLAQEST